MNKEEARQILTSEMTLLRSRSYEDLKTLVGNRAYEIKGSSGAVYQVEIDVLLGTGATEEIQVVGGIDDGDLLKLSTYLVMSESFTMLPNGEIRDGTKR